MLLYIEIFVTIIYTYFYIINFSIQLISVPKLKVVFHTKKVSEKQDLS